MPTIHLQVFFKMFQLLHTVADWKQVCFGFIANTYYCQYLGMLHLHDPLILNWMLIQFVVKNEKIYPQQFLPIMIDLYLEFYAAKSSQ